MMRFIAAINIFIFLIFNHTFSNPDITNEEIYSHIEYLASDNLQGRKPGTPGGKSTAEYLRKQFLGYGLKLAADSGFQYLEVLSAIKPGDHNFFETYGVNGTLSDNFTPVSFSGNGSLSAPVVFVDYGFDLSSDSLTWNSYDGLDVKGKWVMILTNNPDVRKRNSPFDFYSSLRQKTITAMDKGAKGVLFVSGVKADKNDVLHNLNTDEARTAVKIPVIHIKRELADKILDNKGHTIKEIESEIISQYKPMPFETGINVDAKTDLNRIIVKTQNVIALLPGNDPVLKDEYIVIGAHYDHLGMGGPGSGSRMQDKLAVHNGADDNASGVSAMLEAAEKLAFEKNNKRTIVFIGFAAEEMGLLGSRFFVKNPSFDISKIKFMINIDMIGRIDKEKKVFLLTGTGTGEGITELIDKYSRNSGYKINKSESGFGPSDHSAFYAEDIPVLNFFGVAHMDYHTPYDDIEKLNIDGIHFISSLAFELLEDLANRQVNIAFKESGPDNSRREGGRYNFKVTLGIMPDMSGQVENGLRAEMVIPGKPADMAGMKNGDIITAMDGKPVKDIYEYMNRLKEFHSGQRVNIDISRDGEKMVLIVVL